MNYNVSTGLAVLLGLLAVWELVWKGLALWAAGRRQQLGWFVAVLVLNTVGVLPIIYLLLNRGKDDG